MPSVQGGLRAELDEKFRANVPDVDRAVGTDQGRRELVKGILALVHRLGVERPGPVLLSSPLRDGQLLLDAVIPLGLELLAVTGHGCVLQAEVKADGIAIFWQS